MVTRAELHQILDALPEEALPEAGRLLDGLRQECPASQSDVQRIDAPHERLQPDALAAALASATHLGEQFSSRHPHRLAGRGDQWSHRD
ncbi:MAG TPA: hypothetical protein VFD32_18540 [Dehalococcoidia bacterium]|nr:hypothetical protein [Dehalococcoidia bacterium]